MLNVIGWICYIPKQVVKFAYMRHSTLEPWLQKGQLKTVSSLSIRFFGGGFVFAFLLPIAQILDIQARSISTKIISKHKKKILRTYNQRVNWSSKALYSSTKYVTILLYFYAVHHLFLYKINISKQINMKLNAMRVILCLPWNFLLIPKQNFFINLTS